MEQKQRTQRWGTIVRQGQDGSKEEKENTAGEFKLEKGLQER